MMSLVRLWNRIRFLFRRREMERDLEDEVQLHIAMKAEENRSNGMDAEEARYAATRRFGNATQFKERSRELWGWASLERLGQDLKYAFRMLAKDPGFTAVAVVTLALGIGANTTIFSVINAFLVRKPHVEDPDRVVGLWETQQKGGGRRVPMLSTFVEWRKRTQCFEDIALAWLRPEPTSLSGLGRAERVNYVYVTTNFLSTLHVRPILGRTYLPEDATSGDARTLVISHRLWERVFGSDPGILGKKLVFNGRTKTVIGVLPPDFSVVPSDVTTDVWLGSGLGTNSVPPKVSGMRWLTPIARLRPGKTVEQATAELSAISRHLMELESKPEADWGVKLETLQEAFYGGRTPREFFYLLGAVSFVLLIACANVASLLLARAATRYKEIAVRASLGAGRLRLLRQLLTESVLLALLGGALGVLVTFWGIDIFLALAPVEMLGLPGIHIDLRVLAYALGLSLFTGVLFGLAPALQASRPNLSESLKESGGRAPGSARQRTRSALVITEIALALVLLIGAGLMINSIVRLERVDLGFNSKNVLTGNITPDGPKYLFTVDSEMKRLTPQGDELYRQLLERLESLPAVEAAAVKPIGPLMPSFRIVGRPDSARERERYAPYYSISPGYFRTLKIPLLKGRLLTGQDVEGSPWVVVINQAMAKQFFPDEDPIGKELQLTITQAGKSAVEDRPRQIVGVVRDIKQFAGDRGFPMIYGSYRQHISEYPAGTYVGQLSKQVLIRISSKPTKLAGPLQQIVAAMDKDLAVFDVKTMEQALADSLSPYRFMIRLFTIFGGLALLLAAVGIYGVMSYSVSQRTHEIGVRMANGAQTRDVLKLVLWSGLKLTLMGVAVGLAGSLPLTRLIGHILFGIKATDPLTYAIVSLVLTLTALAACYFPARRATKVDPMVALRCE